MTSGNIYFMDKFNVSYERYKMLYANDNMYGIFRQNEFVKEFGNSMYYDLDYFTTYDNTSTDDVLNDVLLLAKAGKVTIKANDVICIKLNGFMSSYKYCGLSLSNKDLDSNFMEVSNFCDGERQFYSDKIHDMNMVVNVTDGRLINMEELDADKYKIYCIDKEVFSPSARTGKIVTNYSVFSLNNNKIVNSNPHCKPFVMIQSALYYYYKSWRQHKNSVLLSDRKEMEILRDYRDLKHERLEI